MEITLKVSPGLLSRDCGWWNPRLGGPEAPPLRSDLYAQGLEQVEERPRSGQREALHQVDLELDEAGGLVRCTAQVETLGRTGVEMEALTAVQVGLLTVYDMCKAVDRGMVIDGVQLLEKRGGKSGEWTASPR